MCTPFHQPETIEFHLPDWLPAYLKGQDRCATIEQRMALVIGASRLNLEHGTGGPFAAAVFERDSGRLVSLGVNLVTSQGLSVLHAEIVALSLAQRQRDRFDLGDHGLPAHQLVSSTEPCAMCLGALCWSGVTSVVVGANEFDARAVGFDEGPKPADWLAELADRGITVVRDVMRDEARAVLQAYADAGSHIYNSRRGGEQA